MAISIIQGVFALIGLGFAFASGRLSERTKYLPPAYAYLAPMIIFAFSIMITGEALRFVSGSLDNEGNLNLGKPYQTLSVTEFPSQSPSSRSSQKIQYLAILLQDDGSEPQAYKLTKSPPQKFIPVRGKDGIEFVPITPPTPSTEKQ